MANATEEVTCSSFLPLQGTAIPRSVKFPWRRLLQEFIWNQQIECSRLVSSQQRLLCHLGIGQESQMRRGNITESQKASGARRDNLEEKTLEGRENFRWL